MTREVCAARVEAVDPDRFAALMATPAPLRARLWPLYAVNAELARAPWASAEPMIAEMRLQWWVDALGTLADEGRVPAHEFGAELMSLRPVAGFLLEIAEARRRDCWREDFPEASGLWAYLEATSGALYEAAGALIGCSAPALRAYGRAAGMANWLLAAPELARRGMQPLPEPADALAAEALAGLRAAEQALPRAARVAVLPAWRASGVLRRAVRTPVKVEAGTVAGSEFARRFSLLIAALRV